MKITVAEHINQINKDDWLRLNNSTCPMLKQNFFQALESSGSAQIKQGWQAHHLLFEHTESTAKNGADNDTDNGKSTNNANTNSEHKKIAAILPAYIKHHSWGEYIFDWAWADAYKRYNLDYYPKLVSTLPFSPIPSNKLLSKSVNQAQVFSLLSQHCEQQSLNSWHLLFCPAVEKTTELPENVFERNTVQFHWFNHNYQDFEHYLSTFTARKRKNTRKERLSIIQQGISIRQLKGSQITEADIDFFYLTYQLTYMKRGHTPHLSKAFFEQIFTALPENILLIIASHQEQDIAAALFFYDESQLYGRYWGSTEAFNNLHFELCYYQGIAFCIENNLQSFNPGTQGEHKIQRGFEPIFTYSYHWIKHQAFQPAIKAFCLQEQQKMRHYHKQCQQALPFNNDWLLLT